MIRNLLAILVILHSIQLTFQVYELSSQDAVMRWTYLYQILFTKGRHRSLASSTKQINQMITIETSEFLPNEYIREYIRESIVDNRSRISKYHKINSKLNPIFSSLNKRLSPAEIVDKFTLDPSYICGVNHMKGMLSGLSVLEKFSVGNLFKVKIKALIRFCPSYYHEIIQNNTRLLGNHYTRSLIQMLRYFDWSELKIFANKRFNAGPRFSEKFILNIATYLSNIDHPLIDEIIELSTFEAEPMIYEIYMSEIFDKCDLFCSLNKPYIDEYRSLKKSIKSHKLGKMIELLDTHVHWTDTCCAITSIPFTSISHRNIDQMISYLRYMKIYNRNRDYDRSRLLLERYMYGSSQWNRLWKPYNLLPRQFIL